MLLKKQPPNKRVQPTPLRVEQDRRYFMCYHVLKAFLTFVAARLTRRSFGGLSRAKVDPDVYALYPLTQ